MKEWDRRPIGPKVWTGKHVLLFLQKILLLSFLCLARRFLLLFYYDFITFYCILSLVFTVAATTGEYWIVYTFYGNRRVYGLWKYCAGIYGRKDCIQNPLTKGNKHLRLTVAATF